MSMQTLTVIQFAWMLLAYCMVMLVLPWLILRRKLNTFCIAEQIAGYFLAGNVYVIYLVFLLQFLHISNRVTLTAGTLLPVAVCIFKRHRGRTFPEVFEPVLLTIQRVLKGETGVRTLVVRRLRKAGKKRRAGQWKVLLKYLPDILLTAAVVAGVLYIYGTNMFTVYGYKASDLPVHNYWVNMMDDNKVFGDGVYPFGFHCVIYYLHVVFGIKTYVLFRVFALVQTIFIHLAIVVSMKILCKTRYAPYIGTGIYLMANIFSRNTYYRYLSTLPQEYGMLFILPAVCFAIRFLQEYAAVLQAEGGAEEELKKRSRWYLTGFIISFSLTLTVHFYNTMAAGVFCVGIAAGYFFRCFRWKYLRQILAAGILSILLALIPLLTGLAMGRGLQASLYWGMNVINGTQASEEQQQTTTITDVDGNEVTVVGEVDSEILEKVKNGTITEGSDEKTGSTETDESWQQAKEQTLLKTLKIKFQAILGEIKVYVADGHMKVVYLIMISIGALMVLGLFSMLTGRRDYGGMLWSVGFYMLFMCIMQSMGMLGLPELMDASRNSIFFAYATGVLWAVAADALVYLTAGWIRYRIVSSAASFVLLGATGLAVVKGDLLKSPTQTTALETNGAITCVTNIIRENEDFTWTIVSPNDELRMTEMFGYHYETITMLEEMQDMSEDPHITIPTDTVYFFIEKTPVNYANSADGLELGDVSEEWAEKPLAGSDSLAAYVGEERWITMSHMYYWAEKFKELYPNEMEVYEETEDFICYRLRQNDYSLYNLAIDYGYNQTEASE